MTTGPSRRPASAPSLDLADLPPRLRAVLDAAVAGEEVTLRRGAEVVGTLSFHPRVLEGAVVHARDPEEPEPARPEGVTVVATAMKLSAQVRSRLSEEFGADYIVLDMKEAPTTADVLLVPPVSPQLVGSLAAMFPQARIVVTEIEDEELGVSYGGQVGRLLDAGATAYLPPRPIAQVAEGVRRHLASSDGPALDPGGMPSLAAIEADHS